MPAPARPVEPGLLRFRPPPPFPRIRRLGAPRRPKRADQGLYRGVGRVPATAGLRSHDRSDRAHRGRAASPCPEPLLPQCRCQGPDPDRRPQRQLRTELLPDDRSRRRPREVPFRSGMDDRRPASMARASWSSRSSSAGPRPGSGTSRPGSPTTSSTGSPGSVGSGSIRPPGRRRSWKACRTRRRSWRAATSVTCWTGR